MRAYAFLAGLSSVVGDPFNTNRYVLEVLAELLDPKRPKELN